MVGNLPFLLELTDPLNFLSLPFDVGVLYALAAFVCMILSSVIRNRTRGAANPEPIERSFCFLLTFLVLFCFVDAVWGTFESAVVFPEHSEFRQWGLLLSTYAFHGMSTLSAFIWSGFLLDYIGLSGKARVGYDVFRWLLLIGTLSLLAANVVTGEVFVVEDCVYTTGPLRPLLFYLQFFAYIAVFVGMLAIRLAKNGKVDTRSYRSAFFFSMIPIFMGFLQKLFPDGPMYSLGFALAAVTIYTFNVTRLRERFFASENNKLSTMVEGLSGDYEAIYYVNMLTGEYDVNSRSGVFEKAIPTDRSFGKDFFIDCQTVVEQIAHPDDFEMMQQMLTRAHIIDELEERGGFSFSYRAVFGDGEPTYYTTKVVRTQNDAEHVIIGVFNADDQIREERRKQEELARARQEAIAANAAKSTFLFNMSHDIRTPMNAIIGFNEIAQNHLDDRERVKDALEKSRNASEHLLSLINDVLDMARIESGKMRIAPAPVNVAAAIESLRVILAETAREKNISLVVKSAVGEHEWILADELRVNQVLLNVLSNAIKYTKAGGTVTYTAEKVGETDGTLSYHFIISDSGVGMTPEFLSHIYEEFSRAQSATLSGVEGTGLGMSIVKRLVDAMGGDIRIESTVGVGTTVSLAFTFPKSEAVTQKDDDIAASAELLAGKRVLLVEDNELNREIAGEILSELGVIYETAGDGEEAVSAVTGKAPTYYDAVLMDIQMPKMNGYEATRAIRAANGGAYTEVPILAMTANAFEEDKRAAIDAGMNGHVAKPINVPELVSALAKVIRK